MHRLKVIFPAAGVQENPTPSSFSQPVLCRENPFLILTYIVAISDYLDEPAITQHSQSNSDIFLGERLGFVSLKTCIGKKYYLVGWLLNFLSNITGSNFMAVFISSAIGATMHAAVYGSRSFTVITIVFVAFMVIGYTYVGSTEKLKGVHRDKPVMARRLSVTTTGHALNNLMAALRAMRYVRG